MITLSNSQRAIVENLNHSLYTPDFLQEWINCNDNVQVNVVNALQAVEAKGFFEAVKCMDNQSKPAEPMKKSDFKKNQTVYLRIRPRSNAERNIEDKTDPAGYVVKATVTSVGNKYITVKDERYSWEYKFEIGNDFIQSGESAIDYELCLTYEQAVQAVETANSVSRLRELTNNFLQKASVKPASIDQTDCKKLEEILNKYK